MSLEGERPVFRPVRRSEVPMLESAPNASGKSPGIPQPPKYGGQRTQRGNGGGNRQQQRQGRPQQQRNRDGNRPAGAQPGNQGPSAPHAPVSGGQQPASKKPAGLFGWVKGLFGTAAPEPGKPAQPGAQPQPFVGGAGEPRTEGGPRRRRRRGGRGRSGGGGQGNPQGGPSGGPQTPGAPHAQSHGQGHPSHGHGGGEHRPQGQGGGGNRRRRGGRGRSGGGGGQPGQGGQGGQGGGHRHDGGGSGIPPSA
ncbi:hypothetical protein FPL22_13970 [Rariglobus hedericola]|uniref:Uncharacterized protein n=1 Tax=Rariglobus hedericola TaxID=2597822 RepID=A0A556QKS2_9BACT|nr:hypothetical protein FPL22_13970 [Rariglobus hedericola]